MAKRKTQYDRFNAWADRQERLEHDMKKHPMGCPKCAAYAAFKAGWKSRASQADRGAK